MFVLHVGNKSTRFKWQRLNEQHRLGERRSKQSLNQAQAIFNDRQTYNSTGEA